VATAPHTRTLSVRTKHSAHLPQGVIRSTIGPPSQWLRLRPSTARPGADLRPQLSAPTSDPLTATLRRPSALFLGLRRRPIGRRLFVPLPALASARKATLIATLPVQGIADLF